MKRLAMVLIGLGLAFPATALGGGFATVGLDPPAGVSAGDRWDATMTILQHGRTPLDGQTPVLAITDGTTTKRFTATPAGKPGVYRASVVFPSDGRWQVTVDHGWGVTHRFAPVDVASASAQAGGAGGGDDPAWLPAIAFALAAGLLAAIATVTLSRRRAAAAP